MTFDEWTKKNKKKDEEPEETKAPSPSTTPTPTQSGGKATSFEDWTTRRNAYNEKMQASQSAESWVNFANDLIREVNQYYSGWRGKDDAGYSSFQQRADSILSHADGWRRVYANNPEAIKTIDSVVSSLSSLKDNLGNYRKYYGQWDSLDAYSEWAKKQEDYDKRWAELSGGYDHSKDSAAGYEGYKAYLYDFFGKEAEKQRRENDKPWWEKMLGYLGDAGQDTSLPVHHIENAKEGYRVAEANMLKPNDAWSQEQLYNYGYLWQEDEAKAAQYAKAVNEKLNMEKEQLQIQQIMEWSTDSFGAGAGHTVGAILTAPLGMADYLGDLVAQDALGYIPEYDGVVTPFEYSQAVTGSIGQHLNTEYGTLDESIPIIGGKGWGDVYGLGTSIAQSAIAGKTGGQLGTLVQFFGSAAASGVDDALSRGASEDQALAYGSMVGLAEGLAEMAGVDNLMKIGSSATIKQLVGNILKQGASEGIEEGITGILNNFADNLVMGDKSNFNALVAEYMKKGLSEEEAKNRAWMDTAEGIAFDMLGGFASGAVHAAPKSIRSYAQTQKQYKNTGKPILSADGGVDALMNLANEVAGVTSADMQTALKDQVGKVGKNATARNVGRLYETVGKANNFANASKNQADIVKSLMRDGFSTEQANSIAEAVVASYNGVELTKAQRNLLKSVQNNKDVREAVANIMYNDKSTMGQRSKNIQDFSKDITLKNIAKASGVSVDEIKKMTEGKMTADAENGSESIYEVSADGKTVDADGNIVSINGITSIEKGRMMLMTEDGNTIDAKSVAYSSQSEALVYEAVASLDGIIDTNTANELAEHLMKLGDATSDMYVKGIKQAYTYGYYHYGREAMTGENTLSGTLTEEQRNVAYGLGEKYRAEHTVAEQAVVDSKKTEGAKTAEKKGGKVHFAGDRNSLTKRQQTSLSALETVADALGVQIYVFESKVDKKGKHIGENGWYDPKDGSIHIDLHAGATGEGTMLFTAAHELVHFIRQWSPAKFKTLADFLMEEYGKKGVSVDALVRLQIAKAKRNGRTISYDTAYGEVIADSMETMLSDGKVMEKLAKLKQKDEGLWNKIKDFISELAAKIRKVYKKMTPDSREGRFVAEMVDAIERLQEMFTEALVDASDNYQSSLTPGQEGTIVNQNGDPVAYSTEDGSVLLSMRTYEEDGRDAFRSYLQKCVSSKKLTKAEMQEMLDGIEDIYQTCKEFKDNYAPFSAWSDASVVRDTHGKPVFSVVTPNGDYKMNLDFSLVCKKRRTLDAVFNEMSRRGIIDDFELGQKSVVKINEIIRKYGLETACALCFVDAKRFRQASMADSFTRLYNELVESLIPEDQKSNIDHFNFSGYETIKKVENGIHTWNASKLDFSHINHVLKTYGDGTVEYKAAKYIKTHAEGRKLLLRGDFMSSQGFDAVKTQNKDILKLYNSKKGTGGPKAAFGDVQYMNEVIQKARWWTPEKAYSVGGIRIQSFSDYVPRMVFDYVQMIYDLAATKLPAHAYTKEALFVKQFGLTGIKINMSLIPAIAEGGIAPGLDANGNYVWAGESFDYDTAVEIQNAEGYTENCGTICVGVSYEHIVKLLRDPNIRMVIPYHKSGLNPIVAHMNKIAQFHDYTNDQRTKGKDGKALEKDFDFSKALHDMGENASPKAVADQYLKWCAAHGYTPRFAEFAMEDNYYKLLEDFTLYDKDGNYVPQREVRAVFPKADSAFGSMKELIQEGLEEDAIVEGKRDKNLSAIVDEIQRTIPKTEAEIEESQVEQADRDLEAIMLSDRVTDQETLDFLNKQLRNGEVTEVYRAMAVDDDGNLYPPMAGYVRKNGKKIINGHPSIVGEWEQSTESIPWDSVDEEFLTGNGFKHFESPTKDYPNGRFERDNTIFYRNKKGEWKAKFHLDKDNGSTVDAAYAPYIHTSLSVLNDQFTSAYTRENLVVVKGYVPNSEVYGVNGKRYQANFADKPVGKTKWHSGVVAAQMPETRTVILSRYFMPIEVVDDAVMAQKTKEMMKGKDIEIPFNVVTPNQRKALEAIGVRIGEARGLNNAPKKADVQFSDRDSEGNRLTDDQQEFFKDSMARDENGNLYVMYHGSRNPVFTEFDMYAGVWMTPDQRYAEVYAEAWRSWRDDKKNLTGLEQSVYADPDYRVYKMYANITNPLDLGEINDEFDRSQMNRLARLLGVPASRIRRIADHDGGWLVYEITRDPAFIDIAKEKGYDGFTATEKGRKTFCAFNAPNQVKLTTNEVPSSFYDIRYSDRDTESVSNRSLLANALESAVKEGNERNLLRNYKTNLRLLEAEQAKLAEVRKQANEIRFTKGRTAEETKKLRDLDFEAKQIANRINSYDRELLKIEAMEPIKGVLDREKKLAYKRAEQKGKEALAEYREKASKTQREMLERWQETRKKGIESREKTAMRHKIQSVVGELNQLLLNEDKKRHVPDSLKKAVADALALVNMDTVGAEERAAKYANLIANETDPDKIDAYTVTMENILRQGEKMGQRLKELRDAYEEIQNSDDPDIANAYDPVIAACLKELSQSIGNTSLRNMTTEQLSDVYDMYRMVLTKVRDANKTFLNEKKESISNLASRVVGEVRKVGGEHKYRAAIFDMARKFGWNNLKPVYAFERIGSNTMTEAFNNVRAGEDVWAMDVTGARKYYLEKSKKYGYDSWDFKKKYRFQSASELEFELTLEQILSLYAYSKRDQALDHLRLGGFVFDSNIETYKEKGSKLIKYKVNTAEAHQITPEILADIIGNLTAEQKGFVDEMQEYLSTTMGAKGNEVTMKMYGVKLFKEKFYFPLKSAKQFLFEQNEVSGEVKIKNSGFTNKVVAKANNPVILNNFMDVWAGHVNDMSMYHAFVLPLEDFNRIFNYNSPKQEGTPPVSVKGTLQSAYTPAAVNYVKELITDLNGGAMSDPRETLAKSLMAKFKKAKVFSSLSVVIQQPSALCRAFALVDMKYFHPTKDGMNHDALWEELKQYAPVAVIKEMGYFDTNMGKSTLDFIKAKEYSGIKEKAKALVTDGGYRDEKLSRLPALADELAWCSIWNAVKRETADKHQNLKPGSEEFLKTAGKRFTEVVTKTQVYDSVLARSANMRSKTGMMSMITSFMAEPTTTINMLEDALRKGKRGYKGYAAKAFASVAISVILNNALVSLVYGMRDDDEDETFAEKYMQSFVSGMLDDINPITYYPFLKDVWSLMQGYDIERSDMSLISDLVDAVNGLAKAYTSEDGDIAEAWWDIAGSVANIGGVPMQNIRRDINGAINLFDTLSKDFGGRETTWGSMGDALEGAVRDSLPVVGFLPGETKADKLYDAIVSGDTAYVERLKAGYKDESAYHSAVRTAIKERFQAGEIDYDTAINHLVDHGGMEEDDAFWKLEEWKFEGNSDEDFSKYNEFYDAVQTGKNLKAVIKKYTDNGAELNDLASQISSHFKPIYMEMSTSERAGIKGYLLNAFELCEVEREDAEKKLQYWEFLGQNPDSDLNQYQIADYYEFAKPAGISADVYTDYCNRVKGITGEGKKERRMAVINSLPISRAQKDALYYAEGWAESKINEAPWH